jgi:hypothetical protein
MDWAILTAVTLVSAYAGYLIGLLVRGKLFGRDGDEGGEAPPEPLPRTPSGAEADFGLWELEVTGHQRASA